MVWIGASLLWRIIIGFVILQLVPKTSLKTRGSYEPLPPDKSYIHNRNQKHYPNNNPNAVFNRAENFVIRGVFAADTSVDTSAEGLGWRRRSCIRGDIYSDLKTVNEGRVGPNKQTNAFGAFLKAAEPYISELDPSKKYTVLMPNDKVFEKNFKAT